MGIIYMAYYKKPYIGQHNKEKLDIRKNQHHSMYLRFLRKKLMVELKKKFHPELNIPVNPSGYCTSLYSACQKYGFRSFTWTILESNIPDNLLDEKEDFYILKHNSLVPNGYNLKINNTIQSSEFIKKYSDESCRKMSESSIISMRNNLEKYRKAHKELEGVPQFVTYFKSGGIRGYRILNHPDCTFKQFADAETDILILKQKTLQFLELCKTTKYKSIQKQKLDRGVPKNIIEQKPDEFLVCFTYNGNRYTKYFGSNPKEPRFNNTTLSHREKNLSDAIKHLNRAKKRFSDNYIFPDMKIYD